MTTPTPPPPGPGDIPPAPPPPFASGPQRPPTNGLAVAALVLGICGIVFAIFPPVGVIVALLAVVFGILGLVRANRMQGLRKGMAIAGVILGVIGMILSIVLFVYSYRLQQRCEDDIGHPPNSDELADCIDRGV